MLLMKFAAVTMVAILSNPGNPVTPPAERLEEADPVLTPSERVIAAAFDAQCPTQYETTIATDKLVSCIARVRDDMTAVHAQFIAVTNEPAQKQNEAVAAWREMADTLCPSALAAMPVLTKKDGSTDIQALNDFTTVMGGCAQAMSEGVWAGADIGPIQFNLGQASSENNCLYAYAQSEPFGITMCEEYKVWRRGLMAMPGVK